MGQDCKKALRIYPQSVLPARRAWPSPWSSFSCQTVLTAWDCGHSFPHTSGPLNPTLPSPVPYRPPCSPSQVKFQGQSHSGLSGGQQEEDGEVTAVTGLWWCTWPCRRGDVGPVLRPEVHHHNLEDHWAPVETGRTKGRGHQNRKKTSKQPSAGGWTWSCPRGPAPAYLSLSCGEPVPSSSSSLSSFMPFSLCRAKSSNTMSSSLVGKTRETGRCLQGREGRRPQRGQRASVPMGLTLSRWADPGQKGLPGCTPGHIWPPALCGHSRGRHTFALRA